MSRPSPTVRRRLSVWAVGVWLLTIPLVAAGQTADLATSDRPGWSPSGKEGCRVWNADPHPGQDVTWSGPCVEGIARGRGELVWRWADRTSRYSGTLIDGRRHGQGTFVYANGDRYSGQWQRDRFHGRGVLEWANKDRYEGEFKDGAITGQGSWIAANGDRYLGAFKDGKRHGEGEMTRANGDSYVGAWRDDRPHGNGEGRIGGKRLMGTWTDGCYRDDDEIAAWGRPIADCD